MPLPTRPDCFQHLDNLVLKGAPFRAVGKKFSRHKKKFPRQEIVNGTAGNFFFTAGKKIATAGNFGRCGREPEAPPAAFQNQPKCEVPSENSCSATRCLLVRVSAFNSDRSGDAVGFAAASVQRENLSTSSGLDSVGVWGAGWFRKYLDLTDSN